MNNLIYLHKLLGDLVRFNPVIHFLAILSRMPLAEANCVNHFPAVLSRMPLAEANHINHIPTILSRLPLAEANRVNHNHVNFPGNPITDTISRS